MKREEACHSLTYSHTNKRTQLYNPSASSQSKKEFTENGLQWAVLPDHTSVQVADWLPCEWSVDRLDCRLMRSLSVFEFIKQRQQQLGIGWCGNDFMMYSRIDVFALSRRSGSWQLSVNSFWHKRVAIAISCCWLQFVLLKFEFIVVTIACAQRKCSWQVDAKYKWMWNYEPFTSWMTATVICFS